MLVDEYQDTNRLQASILLALKPDGKGLTVVGDDAQSIYSFRAATVRNILDFPGSSRPRPTIVTLEQNYRSTQPILAAANAVIDLADERFTKNLWSRRDVGRAAASGRRARRGRAGALRGRAKSSKAARTGSQLKAQAVLFRASHHSAPLEIELTRRNIPFVKFGGLKFLEAAHVKDCCRCCAGRRIRATVSPAFASCNCCRASGPATAAEVLDRIAERADRGGGAGRGSSRRRRRPSIGRISSKRFGCIRGRAAGWPAELDVARRWYEPHLERIHDDAHVAPGRSRAARADRRRPIRAASAS